jgi:hypothetical protein
MLVIAIAIHKITTIFLLKKEVTNPDNKKIMVCFISPELKYEKKLMIAIANTVYNTKLLCNKDLEFPDVAFTLSDLDTLSKALFIYILPTYIFVLYIISS